LDGKLKDYTKTIDDRIDVVSVRSFDVLRASMILKTG